MVVSTRRKRRYRWRVVDQDGDVSDIFVQKRKEMKGAKRFFRKLLKGQGQLPLGITTDKLGSYVSAKREVMVTVPHCRDRYANNRAANSQAHTRTRERQMRRFRHNRYAQRFLAVFCQCHNL